jgi:PAS domain S-box-containing protein
MNELKKFALFIQNNCFDEIASTFSIKLKEEKFGFLSEYYLMPEDEFNNFIKTNFDEFLSHIINDTIFGYINKNVRLWKEDKVPGIKRNQPGLRELIRSLSIRKHCLIQFLPKYTDDVSIAALTMKELVELYDHYREQIYQTFLEIQHEDIERQKEFAEAILDTTVEGISGVDKNLQVRVWNKSLAERTSISKNDIIGKNIFDFFPANKGMEEEMIRKAQAGEYIHLESVPIKSRPGYYDVDMIPWKDNQGAIIGSLSFSRDVTEKKKNIDRINEINVQLQQQQTELNSLNEDLKEKIILLENTQRKLEDALNYYLTILDDFPALIWQSDTTGACNYFNKTWLGYTGKTLEEEYGNGWLAGVHPDELKRCLDIYTESFNKRQAFEMEYRLRSHDGLYRWLLDMGKPLYGLDGEFIGFLGACFDIQDRRDDEFKINQKNRDLAVALEALKHTEEQLVEANYFLEQKIDERTKELAASEEQLKQTLEHAVELNNELIRRENFLSSIIDQTPVSTYIVDAEGTLVRINQACLDLFEIEDPSSIVGKYNILKDEVLMEQGFYKDIRKVFEDGEIANFSLLYNPNELVHTHINSNKTIYLNVKIFPIKNTANKVMSAVIQQEDVTSTVLAEKALKKSEEQLRLITESLPVLISYVDKDLYYRFVNKAYSEWFKKDKDEIIGMNAKELLGSNFNKIHKLMKQVLEGTPVKSEEFIYIGDENKKDVLINYIPHSSNGQIDGFYALISDITPLKKAQEELMKKNQELVRINTDLDNFIYSASHDLKSPIVNMEGLMAALERTLKPKLDTREDKLFEMMGASIMRLKSTISSLSDVTKIAKNFEKTVQLINIPELVEDVKNDISELIKESNVRFVENYRIREIDFVKANLKSILYNLISNAIKYRSPEREAIVQIFTFEQNDHYVICIEDNGLGLSESQQAKLFSMFKRIHKQGEGSGIGLYIIKRIVENVNGKIVVESQEGKGSRFMVNIPKRMLN